jgi:hypothetical protein
MNGIDIQPLEFTREETAPIASQAQARGFASAKDYVQALIAADKLVAAVEQDAPDEDEHPHWREDLRSAWMNALTGNVLSEEEFWEALDDDKEI